MKDKRSIIIFALFISCLVSMCNFSCLTNSYNPEIESYTNEQKKQDIASVGNSLSVYVDIGYLYIHGPPNNPNYYITYSEVLSPIDVGNSGTTVYFEADFYMDCGGDADDGVVDISFVGGGGSDSETTGTHKEGTLQISKFMSPSDQVNIKMHLKYTDWWGTVTIGELTEYTQGTARPASPTNFNAYNPTYSTIDLYWTNGIGSDKTKVMRKIGSYPTSPTDTSATQVYFGTGTSTQDTGLTPGTTYYYRAWGYDIESGYYSSGYGEDYETTSSNIASVTFYMDPITGSSITFDGETYNNGEIEEVEFGSYSITANPPSNYVFSYWATTGSISIGSSQSTTVTISGSGTITAHFTYNLYTITFYTIPTNGGTIYFDGDQWANGQSGPYAPGTYDIQASPASQHNFDQWQCTGGVSVSNPGQQSTSAIVTGSGSLTAKFQYNPTTYRIDFYTDPTFVGKVRFDYTDYLNGQWENYQTGTYEIDAVLTSEEIEKYQFVRWYSGQQVSISDVHSKKTTATVSGPGSVKAEFQAKSNLKVPEYYLDWSDIKPGDTVNGYLIVKNDGGPGTYLNWEITSWPNWGTWTFSQTSGNDLEVGGQTRIDVTIVAPKEKNQEFTGSIKIFNSDNSDDYEEISVHLKTPKVRTWIGFNLFIQKILERYQTFFQILKTFLV